MGIEPTSRWLQTNIATPWNMRPHQKRRNRNRDVLTNDHGTLLSLYLRSRWGSNPQYLHLDIYPK
jgi:hypothetical protein